MTINSRSKGKNGELELVHFLKERNVEARRGQQFAGGGDSPDVVTSLDRAHFECKRVETGNPYNWLDQAIRDCRPGRMPVVAHRRSRRDWIAVMRLSDVVFMFQKIKELEDTLARQTD